MFWSFVSPKGGVGVSVIAVSVALQVSCERPVILVDFCGDVPDILGLDTPTAPGISDWLCAGNDVSTDALANLAIEVSPGLSMIPRGTEQLDDGSSTTLVHRCAEMVGDMGANGFVVADVGVLNSDPFSVGSVVATAGDRTTMVIRACYLALRRARHFPMVIDEIVEVVEGGRALSTVDIEAVLGRAVTARLPVDPAIARAVDTGLTDSRLPRKLRRLARGLLLDEADRLGMSLAQAGVQ